jgi:hypothetical protein
VVAADVDTHLCLQMLVSSWDFGHESAVGPPNAHPRLTCTLVHAARIQRTPIRSPRRQPPRARDPSPTPQTRSSDISISGQTWRNAVLASAVAGGLRSRVRGDGRGGRVERAGRADRACWR